ncbi:type II toxin-antitoxin system ParD family antitoxin [Labrys sp. (in: a-proteobacteria)]|uniref:type II toxin-antitoxin system ParD family antitoxin n=1 Tax=Labrys sp. (in: a-proteobacteria) TaxID=1917972 RepID=UPI0039E322FA
MARNTSVSLGDHFAAFIDEQVDTGRYGSASDVVRAGLRLLEEQEVRFQALRDALIAGEESGPPKPFDGQAFLKRLHDKHAGEKQPLSSHATRRKRS